jgi:hypothetical protein
MQPGYPTEGQAAEGVPIPHYPPGLEPPPDPRAERPGPGLTARP